MINAEYYQGALDTISQSNFQTLSGIYIYAKVSSIADYKDHFLVSKDADEITVITKEENLAKLALLERNKDDYRLIALNVSVPFYSVGFLATVSDRFAKKNMNVLIVSTYSKDYLLIRADLINVAENILHKLGFQNN